MVRRAGVQAVTAAVFGCAVTAAAAPQYEPQNPRLPRVEQIRATVEIERYEVEGRRQSALERSLDFSGPLGYDAQTRYEVAPYFEFQESASGCGMTHLEFDLHLTFTYPRWVDYDRARRDMRRAWDARLQRLDVHEQVHGLIAFMGTVEAYNAMVRVASAPDCAALEDQVRAAFDAAMDRVDEEQDRYDDLTDHGADQEDFAWDEFGAYRAE